MRLFDAIGCANARLGSGTADRIGQRSARKRHSTLRRGSSAIVSPWANRSARLRQRWAAIFEWKYSYDCRHIQLGLSSTPGRNRWFGPSLGRVERVKKRAPYAIVRTTPPSTRKEVPVVADACSEQT